MAYRLHDPLVVECDNVDLLVEDIGIEKSKLSGSPTDVVPLLVVEDADAGWRTQDLGHFVLSGGARMDLGDLVLRGKIAALFHIIRAPGDYGSARDARDYRNKMLNQHGWPTQHRMAQRLSVEGNRLRPQFSAVELESVPNGCQRPRAGSSKGTVAPLPCDNNRRVHEENHSSKGQVLTEIVPEFSRLVRIAGLGSTPFRQRIEATPDERRLLSRRFDLLALDRLAAVVELRRQDGEVVLLEATFEAEFVQACTVTLDPVPGSISDRFSLVYAPINEQPHEFDWGVDEPAFEPLWGDTIDIGEAVAQELSLSLPLSPRHPDAGIDVEFSEESNGPFGSLARLLGRDES